MKMRMQKELKNNDSSFSFRNDYVDVHTIITLLFSVYVVTWYLEVGKRIDDLGRIRFEFLLGSFLGIVAISKVLSSPSESDNRVTPLIVFFSIVLLSFLSWHYLFAHLLKVLLT